MGQEAYLRLFRALNDSRFDSDEANAAIRELGSPARVLRALARARRHNWASARADLCAALDEPGLAPIVELVAGVGLFVVRDYDRSLSTLARAAGRGKPGITKQARMIARRFADALGWAQEARALAAALGERLGPEPAGELEQLAALAPKQAAARAHARLFERGPEHAAALLDALLARRPEQPEFVRARLHVALIQEPPKAVAERLAALPARLREQLPAERAALALALDDADEATVRTAHPRDEPRLLYLRGRALLTLGEFGEASELFERARAALPDAAPISLALALARHYQSPRTFGEGLERRFEELCEQAPALLSDAAADVGVELWTDAGLLEDRADKVTLLERAFASLTPEADLTRPSYRIGSGPLRHLPAAAESEAAPRSPLRRIHTDDRELIAPVERALIRAIGVNPPRPRVRDSEDEAEPAPEPADAIWTPRSLSPEQLERFLVDGFLVIPRAFDPELARAWREDANRRIREEPERWVRGYDPSDAKRSLRDYSPDDPSTWTWGRVDLEGPETVRIDEFAPAAWAAICDLLGGPARIKTRTWTNYLIINFCADAHLGFDQPQPFWESWHIDDPSPLTRLDRIQNGLVCITLFDRLLPASGNTWIAPDSVGRVARELAAHPQGVDFVADRGSRITMQCERFQEVVGEAGDILLMHPLMMHSSSPNRSGRIRWMGNPMVYLREPLDPFRPVEQMSPVELAIHRAIT